MAAITAITARLRSARAAGGTLFIGLLLIASPGHAHDPGLSALSVERNGGQVGVHLVVARREIEPLVTMDTDGDGVVSASELAGARPRLQALAADAIVLDDGRAGSAIPDVGVELDDSDALHLRFELPVIAGGGIRVHVPLIARLALGHRQYVQVRDATGRRMAEHVLQADASSFAIAGDEGTPAGRERNFRAFFLLGVEHIATGFDHLLFLLALLVVGPRPRSAAWIITSFTAAHSVTLALATFGLVPLAPRIVEPLIAGSILYVGVENLGGRRLAPRWIVTFAFGLVHGLGFATVLRDLGVGAAGASGVLPLLAFNVGVETGQLALAALVLPLVWKAQRRPRVFARVATACSILVALAGAVWLVERSL